MVNPYYFFFYLFYKVLKPLAKDEGRIPFAIIAFMSIVFIIHTVILFITIKTHYGVSILPGMNKLLFGGIFTVIYFTINNLLFERNNRYIKLMKRIKEAPFYQKIVALSVIIVYFLSPLLITAIN